MPFLSKLKTILIIVPILMINEVSFAHVDEDIIINNFGDLGKVDFPMSCSTAVQKQMVTGVALMPHMMYAQAEKLFSSLINIKPECAMLYWGYSMTLFHPLWPDKISDNALALGETAINKAIALNATSKREKLYIKATADYYHNWKNVTDGERHKAWEQGQQLLYKDYPEDIDAASFYALSQLATASKKDKAFSQQKNAGIILEQLYKKSPTHPGTIHYTIHAYDNAMLAEPANGIMLHC